MAGSRSSYVESYISGIDSRLAGARSHVKRGTAILRRVQADCFLSRRFNGSLHRTRRKKIRKTTDMFCTLPQYFIGDSRIAPTSRRSPQHFSIVASAFLSLFFSLFLASAPSLGASQRVRQLFRPFFTEFRGANIPSFLEPHSLAPALPSAPVISARADVVRTFEQSTYPPRAICPRTEVRRSQPPPHPPSKTRRSTR